MRATSTLGSLAVAAAILISGLAAPASAQQSNTPLRVFFDCQGPSCEQQFYRTEIDWVTWVTQQEDADVHVIIASIQNASGGREYDIRFVGQYDLEGIEDALVFRSLGTDVEQERLDGITEVLEVGFARLAILNGLRGVVQVTGVEAAGIDATERVVSSEEVDDPWNLWVFEIGGNVELNGEDLQSQRQIRGNFSADRVTPEWILGIDFRYGNNYRRIERSDGSIFENTLEDYTGSLEFVKAIADHWSLGVTGSIGAQPRFNQDFRWEVLPGIEYSYFPYVEATRRALTAFYQIGPAHRDYEEVTIFGETEETRLEHLLRFEFSQRQPWGNASVNLQGEQFLHDTGLYNVSLGGRIDVRLFRGLNMNVNGSYSFGDNQIFLSAGGQSDEEILLRLRQRQTNEQYRFQVGFEYQFGSIYNNIVNNRFDGRSGFGGGGGGR